MRVALKFAYDGKAFHGYARQPHLLTVEGEVIKALIKHGIIEDTSESFFRSAGRTDKGVSALCNIIAFNTDASKKSILQDLSNEFTNIVFYGAKEVEVDFNPRYAKLRHYRYYLLSGGLDVKKIISAGSLFTGEHNFSNFARIESFKEPTRSIENIVITKEKKHLVFDFYAPAFLRHQVRRIISTLEKIGENKIVKEQIVEALYNPNKKVDFGLAPAEPLILVDISYDFEFEHDKELTDKKRFLEEKIISSLKK